MPAVAGRRVGHPAVLEASLAAFVAFGLVASATYVVNDVLDRDADRRHATKRRRPYAGSSS